MENRHGLTLQVAYTYSHEIDEVTNDLNSLSNPFNPSYDCGSGGFDRRHIFNVNYIYNFPFFAHNGNALERTILGGWQFSGMTVAQTGAPALDSANNGIRYSPDVLGLGGDTTNRPNLVAPISYPKKVGAWFNTSSLPHPLLPGTAVRIRALATAGKDVVVGPGLFNFNWSLFKTIPLLPTKVPAWNCDSSPSTSSTTRNSTISIRTLPTRTSDR